MSGARQGRKSRPAQRWPDLMVGAITLALLAGFGTLIFSERNRPLVAQTPPAQPTPAPVIPASPGTVPEPRPLTPPAAAEAEVTTTPGNAGKPSGQSAGTPQAGTPPATTQALDPANSATAPTPAPADPAATPAQTQTTTPAPTAPAGTTPGLAQTGEIPPAPAAPPVTPIQPPVLPETPTPQAQPTTPATQTATTPPASPAVPARAGGAVATSENRVPLRSDYRISLGSFTTRKTVESQTANVRGLGYTVHAIDLGDQYVAQIGPFASEAEASRALADIQRAYPSALLYRPRNAPAETTSASSTPSPAAADTSTPTSTTETTPSRPQAAAPSGPSYLQVGAFDREESAQRLVGILHDNGFNPTVNSPEGRKTTVMVGPYSGDALLRAEARLDNAGLDHFRVR